MAFTDDLLKLEKDAGDLILSVDGIIPQVKAVVADLEALGIDAAGLFRAKALGQNFAMAGETQAELVGKVNWQNVLALIEKYGPALYNMLAMMLHWPSLPFPVPAS